MPYDAPIEEIEFSLKAVAGIGQLEGLPTLKAYD